MRTTTPWRTRVAGRTPEVSSVVGDSPLLSPSSGGWVPTGPVRSLSGVDRRRIVPPPAGKRPIAVTTMDAARGTDRRLAPGAGGPGRIDVTAAAGRGARRPSLRITPPALSRPPAGRRRRACAEVNRLRSRSSAESSRMDSSTGEVTSIPLRPSCPSVWLRLGSPLASGRVRPCDERRPLRPKILSTPEGDDRFTPPTIVKPNPPFPVRGEGPDGKPKRSSE